MKGAGEQEVGRGVGSLLSSVSVRAAHMFQTVASLTSRVSPRCEGWVYGGECVW